MTRISIPYAPLSLCLLVMLTAGCQRSVESTVGDAPNLVAWTKSIKDQPPTASPKPLPLLTDTAVFDYSSRSLKSVNPNPASALQRAQANGGGSTSPSALDAPGAASDQDSPSQAASSASTVSPAPVDALPATPALAMAQGLPGLISLDGHLRDPFAMPITSDPSQNTVRPQTGRPKEALEAFPLDGLKMVGSIGVGSDIMALVQASDRVVYHVRVGQYMGEHDGKVVAVTPERIDLIELMPNPNGSWTEKAASIPLSE